MENASKALIIAGAILLSILIIGLGMGIYTSATSSAGNTDMSAEEISSHNQKFTAYEKKQKGTNIRTLLNMIASNNEQNEDRQIKVDITKTSSTGTGTLTLTGTTTAADIRAVIGNVPAGTTFTVSFDYGGAGGLIQGCSINY